MLFDIQPISVSRRCFALLSTSTTSLPLAEHYFSSIDRLANLHPANKQMLFFDFEQGLMVKDLTPESEHKHERGYFCAVPVGIKGVGIIIPQASLLTPFADCITDLRKRFSDRFDVYEYKLFNIRDGIKRDDL